jgi:hypothetical protein
MVLGLFGLSLLVSLLAYCLRKSLRLVALVLVLVVIVPLVLLAVTFGHMPG